MVYKINLFKIIPPYLNILHQHHCRNRSYENYTPQVRINKLQMLDNCRLSRQAIVGILDSHDAYSSYNVIAYAGMNIAVIKIIKRRCTLHGFYV